MLERHPRDRPARLQRRRQRARRLPDARRLSGSRARSGRQLPRLGLDGARVPARARPRLAHRQRRLGRRHGSPAGPYSASKHAQLAFSRSLAVELAPRGVSVHTVNPGFVETPGFPQRDAVRRARAASSSTRRSSRAAPRRGRPRRAEIFVPRWYRPAPGYRRSRPGAVARAQRAYRRRKAPKSPSLDEDVPADDRLVAARGQARARLARGPCAARRGRATPRGRALGHAARPGGARARSSRTAPGGPDRESSRLVDGSRACRSVQLDRHQRIGGRELVDDDSVPPSRVTRTSSGRAVRDAACGGGCASFRRRRSCTDVGGRGARRRRRHLDLGRCRRASTLGGGASSTLDAPRPRERAAPARRRAHRAPAPTSRTRSSPASDSRSSWSRAAESGGPLGLERCSTLVARHAPTTTRGGHAAVTSRSAPRARR